MLPMRDISRHLAGGGRTCCWRREDSTRSGFAADAASGQPEPLGCSLLLKDDSGIFISYRKWAQSKQVATLGPKVTKRFF